MEKIIAILIITIGGMLGVLLEIGGMKDPALFWFIGFTTGILAMTMIAMSFKKEKRN